jgi:phosphate uptake regulator
MVRDSLNAFVRKDARLASQVLTSDDEVDALYKQIFTSS